MNSSEHELVVKVVPDFTEVDAELARRQQPSIGRVVHYVSHGSPVRPDGTQAFTSQCRAAIITEVGDVVTLVDMKITNPKTYDSEIRRRQHDRAPESASLAVLNPTGMFFTEHVRRDDGTPTGRDDSGVRLHTDLCGGKEFEGGTWHWPEHV